MALALLTRADASLASEWADNAPADYGYEVLLVCDTTGSSPRTPWAVFCPSMDLASAGCNAQDALNMIADAIHEALADGVAPISRSTEEWLGDLYREMVDAGCPTATAVVRPMPYSVS